jgi:hypothetical protein
MRRSILIALAVVTLILCAGWTYLPFQDAVQPYRRMWPYHFTQVVNTTTKYVFNGADMPIDALTFWTDNPCSILVYIHSDDPGYVPSLKWQIMCPVASTGGESFDFPMVKIDSLRVATYTTGNTSNIRMWAYKR